MILVNYIWALVAIAIAIILSAISHYTAPRVAWGSISQALIFHQVRKYALKVRLFFACDIICRPFVLDISRSTFATSRSTPGDQGFYFSSRTSCPICSQSCLSMIWKSLDCSSLAKWTWAKSTTKTTKGTDDNFVNCNDGNSYWTMGLVLSNTWLSIFHHILMRLYNISII